MEIQNNIFPRVVEDWVRNLIKNINNVSIIWKGIVLLIPVIKRWLMLKVGNGSRVSLGEDPWVKYNANYRFPIHMIDYIRNKDLCKLCHIVDVDLITIYK